MPRISFRADAPLDVPAETASFAPAQTTGNTSTLTLTASSTATLGNATVTISASSATTPPHSTTVALTNRRR